MASSLRLSLPSPRCPPLNYCFQFLSRRPLPQAGAARSPLLSLKSYHGGPVPPIGPSTSVSAVFVFVFWFIAVFFFSLSSLTPTYPDHQRDFLCNIFNKFCRHRPWYELSSYLTDMLEIKANNTRVTTSKPFSGSLFLWEWKDKDDSRILWTESSGPVSVVTGKLCECWLHCAHEN